jgi:hypothetical protein
VLGGVGWPRLAARGPWRREVRRAALAPIVASDFLVVDIRTQIRRHGKYLRTVPNFVIEHSNEVANGVHVTHVTDEPRVAKHRR